MNLTSALRTLVALLAGTLFGFGLSMSGMIDPARVLGFLDIASEHWDPSLGFVLAGAVLVALPGIMLQHLVMRPALDERFHLPTKTAIDRRLLAGSLLLGSRWLLSRPCYRGNVLGSRARLLRGGYGRWHDHP